MFLVDLVMEVETVRQIIIQSDESRDCWLNNITQTESDEEGMGKTDFCPGIELGTSVWNASALTTEPEGS